MTPVGPICVPRWAHFARRLPGDFGEAKAAYLEALTVAEVAGQEKIRQVAVANSLEKLLAAAKDRPEAEVPAETLGEWKGSAQAQAPEAAIID